MAGQVLEITNENFQSEIIDSGASALVDFSATWCGPCKTLEPIVEELAAEYASQGIKVCKVDIDAAPDLAAQFSVQGVPTLMFFKGGEKVDQMVGAHPRTVIEGKLKELL